ncbi:hypothetical protein I6N98_11630 [Spongiibacter nanhainus]|uniref:PilY1 beta-propeller domain-containing protein n=1 Tax=Spongiibacter nanhainus TaxID=2794344 RepID=A0A7T4QYH0_9GAMM|nr:PilC/PilY family type IV pilus protein [Spongiibacter nanhainus]QQD17026.1 hypothetical protein I6N98_11630 [Spongiibacter nanhainus]
MLLEKYAQKVMASLLRLFVVFCCACTTLYVHAEDCTVKVESDSYVGKKNKVRTYVFDSLDSIDSIAEVDLKNSKKHACPPKTYSTSGNILRVDNSDLGKKEKYCQAKFTVIGVKADCESDVPVSSDIAQKPLFLTQSASPNVMYMLDDSGSMHFELMPGEILLANTRYIFPRADDVYGSGDYSNYVPTVDDKSAYNARTRSPQINTVYYDPGVTYDPWIKHDGNFYPNADPKCAYHNPERTGGSSEAYCRNLTTTNERFNSNRWYDCDSSGSCSYSTSNKKFWPAKYFWHTGGSSWDWDNFDEVEIKITQSSYKGHGRENRDDCEDADNSTCSYEEELQNFANWYTYYRSRVLTARAGSGYAFSTQSGDLRVGFGSINQGEHDVDGKDHSAIVDGVRKFTGEDRKNFYDSLYKRDIPNAGTPLRSALNEVGEYYSRKDNRGPWGEEPGSDVDEDHLICRRNYTVLMTDGYWSGSNVSGGPGDNNDGTDKPSHTGPAGQSYTYKAASPFKDNEDDTLADVAMYYWKNDLRDDLDNQVFVTKKNPAFWQHMVTFGVGFGVSGTVNPDDAFAAISTGAQINWPDPGDAEINKIDDLLHAGVNSRGGFFSAANPDQFAAELSGVLDTIANESKSSASAIAANSTRLDSGTLVYQASFNSLEWTGRLIAYTLADNGALDKVFWDTNKGGIPAHGSRSIFTFVGDPGSTSKQGVAFTTGNWKSLSAGQRSSLNDGGSDDDGKDLLNWLRGDKSKEGTSFRTREGLLGDIVNSDPFFVGTSEDYGYSVLGGDEGTKYSAYLQAKAARSPMIYVGANDGMLHGFDAETGKESFAVVLSSLYSDFADLADVDYDHQYFVDGSPRALDAYINGAWTTVLVGATGAGGRAVYAIDVGTPDSMAAGDLMWEFTTADDADDKLGVAMSAPAIARVDAGDKWVAVFGNGYKSGDTLKLFVVDLATGDLIKAIDTELSGAGNGLATPVPVDVDGDRITDYVYAGDLAGNLWKFDLTGNSSSKWAVSHKSGSSPAPMFKAVDDDDNPQPITSRPTVGRHPDGGYMVYVGTGQYFKTTDGLVPESPQIQAFYGIRDSGSVVDRDDLVEQTIVYEAVGSLSDNTTTDFQVRIVSSNSADNLPEYGWRLELLSPENGAEAERSVSRPVLRNGRIIFATIIPNENLCGFGGRSWLMELDALNGGLFADPVLDINGDGKIDDLDKVLYKGVYYPVSGIGSEELIKTPGIIGAGDLEYKYTSGSSGSIGVVTETGDGDQELGRQSWRQLQ